MKSAILVIYTGGTIGMKQDPFDLTLKPFDFSQILEEVPEVRKFAVKVDTYTFDPLIDSSDVEPSMWVRLAELIKEKYDHYDGFVVLHGTDTMAYTASALSFMLDGLAKPVILTGSQLPIGAPRTDGKENFVSAIEIAAAKDAYGTPIVPEVAVYFDSLLLRGCRTIKVSADEFSAFRSPNFPPLAQAGITIRYDRDNIRRPYSPGGLSIHTALDTRVSILKVHPGITEHVVRSCMCGPETRAVIMETFGSGNAPSRGWFLDIVKEAAAQGKILVNVTQCNEGSVNMDRYATGKPLKQAGVVCGYDSTTEAMLAKLFVLLGECDDNSLVKKSLEEDLRGEITK